MDDRTFLHLWNDELSQPNKELYISEYGYPDWFDTISENLEIICIILSNIHDVAHMNVKNIIKHSEMTQNQFATHFCINLRTVERWCSGERKCPDYLRLLFCKDLGILNISKGSLK